MRIGISLDPYGSKHARYGKDTFKKLSLHGYSAVDYNMQNTETELYTSNENELKRILGEVKARADEEGIIFSQVHGPWRYPPMDSTEEQRKERMDKCRRSLLATSILGCKYWVVHPIMPYGTSDISLGKENETWDMNIIFMKELISYAREYGITVCIENMPMLNFSLAKPERILDLVKHINDDNFKICLDTGHVNVFPELSVARELERLGDYVKALHVHDNLKDKDGHLYPTRGTIDWSKVSEALHRIGFDGVFSLECAPSPALDNDLFDKESSELFCIANEIIKQ